MNISGVKISKQTWIAALIGIVSLAAALGPIFVPGTYAYASADGPFHLARIEGIYLDLLEGIFPAKVHMAAAAGYGYGCGFFYPDCFLYIPACLMLLGVSLETSWKIYNVLVILAMYIAMSYSIRVLDRDATLVMRTFGAAYYVLSYRFIRDVYYLGSIGSATAMIFIPLMIAGLMRILWDEHNWRDLLVLTIGACGLLLSHLTTTIIVIVFLLLLVIGSIRRVIERPLVLVELAGCVVVGALLTIAFWLPMFEQLMVQEYKCQTELLFKVEEQTVTLGQIRDTLGDGTIFILLAAVGLLATALFVTARKGVSKSHSNNQETRNTAASYLDVHNAYIYRLLAILAVSLLFVAITHYPPFWLQFGYAMEWLQFPQRILSASIPALILISVLAGSYLIRLDLRIVRYSVYGLAIVALIASLYQSYRLVQSSAEPDHLESGLITDRIEGLGGGQEWLPDDADRSGLHEPNKSYDPDSVGADGFKHDHSKYYEVYVLLDKAYYDVPYLYYKGYAAYLLDDNGAPVEQLEVGKSDRLAYVRVYMPEGREGIGHIMVTYRKTTIQKAAYVLNVMSVVALGIVVGASMVRRRRGQAIQ